MSVSKWKIKLNALPDDARRIADMVLNEERHAQLKRDRTKLRKRYEQHNDEINSQIREVVKELGKGA